MKTNVSRALPDPRRAGFIGALLLAVMLVVAACGTDTAPTQTPAAAQPTATSASIEPGATSTSATATEATATTAMAGEPTGEATIAADPTATTAAAVEPTAEPSATAASAEVVEIQATLLEWGLEVSQTEVKAGTVRFVVSNGGRLPHNFAIRIDGGDQLARTPNFAPSDGAQILEVELAPGAYVVYCALPGHEQQGQRNVIIVS